MAGKIIYICDDSILGFGLTFLKERYERGLTNKKYITFDEFEKIKRIIIHNVKISAQTGDIVDIRTDKKEYFTPDDIKTGTTNSIFFYDKTKRYYYTNKPLPYLKATYNKRASVNNPETYKYYSNPEILSLLLPESQSSK